MRFYSERGSRQISVDAQGSASLAYIAVNNKSCLKQGGSQEPTLRLSPDLHICTMASEHPGISVPTLTTPTPATYIKSVFLAVINQSQTLVHQDFKLYRGTLVSSLKGCPMGTLLSIMCIIHKACMLPGTRQGAFSLLFKDKETEVQGGKQPDLCLLV